MKKQEFLAPGTDKKISLGVEHNEYKKEIELEPEARASLAKDLTKN